jgi:hypothetical protein
MNIGLITGFWSTNIGNAFFHLGADWLLRDSDESRSSDIYWLNNMPGYWRIFNKRNPHNSVRGIGEPRLDVLIMVGPFLREAFPDIWTSEILKLKAMGTRIVMVGLGAMQHDEKTRGVCRKWFEKIRPDCISTRDSATYKVLDGLGLNLHNGICPAFFVSNAIEVKERPQEKYIVLNCEKISEPKILSEKDRLSSSIESGAFDVGSVRIDIDKKVRSKYLERFSELGMAFRDIVRASEVQAEVDGVPIYRTIHRSNPFILRSLFGKRGTMISDVPHPYLLAYANASLVVTDRVHTAVACISYGTPVAFVGKTKREGLLASAGATIAADGWISVNESMLWERKATLRALVKEAVFG